MGDPRVELGWRRPHGVGAMEYVILLLAIASVVLIATRLLGVSVREKTECVALRVGNPDGPVPPQCRGASPGPPPTGTATRPPTPAGPATPTPNCFDIKVLQPADCPNPDESSVADACAAVCPPSPVATCERTVLRQLAPCPPLYTPIPDMTPLRTLYEVVCRRCFYPSGAPP